MWSLAITLETLFLSVTARELHEHDCTGTKDVVGPLLCLNHEGRMPSNRTSGRRALFRCKLKTTVLWDLSNSSLVE